MPKVHSILLAGSLGILSIAATAYYGANARIERADSLRSIEAAVEAEGAYLAAVERNPYDADAWIALARFYTAANRLDEAQAAYDRAASILPEDAGIILERSENRIRLNLFDEAEADLAALREREPYHARALVLSGWLHLRAVDTATGETLRPRDARLHLAERFFGDVLRIDAGAAEAYVGLAAAARFKDRPDEATRLLERAVALDSNLYWGWQTLGEVLAETGRGAAARAAFERAAALAQGRPYSLMELAILSRASGRPAEAASYLERVGPSGAYDRGVDLMRAGRSVEAEAAFLEALLADPEDDIALERLETVRIINHPADSEARNELARRRLARGAAAERVRHSLQAYANYRKAILLAPQLSEARLMMARFLDREGAYTASVRELQRVEELTRSQNERLVGTDLMEVVTRKALTEMEEVHAVSFEELSDQPTSELGRLIGNPELIEAKMRWSVNPVPKPRVRIAILPFIETARPQHQRIGELTAERLLFNLGLLPGYELVPLEEVRAVMEKRMVGAPDQADPGRLAAALGAEIVVQGEILERAENLRVEIRIIKAPAGPVIWRQTLTAHGAAAFDRALMEMTRLIATKTSVKGEVIRRPGPFALTINLGRIHGLATGDTIVVTRPRRQMLVSGLDWPGERHEEIARGRILRMTERYSEAEIITPEARLRAGDLVSRLSKE
jgi:tetratricopeptide (TPR) repeat protein/TolB-like protein